MTTAETADWICRPAPTSAAAAETEAEELGVDLPPMQTLLQWEKVLLELDAGLAALYADVKASRVVTVCFGCGFLPVYTRS